MTTTRLSDERLAEIDAIHTSTRNLDGDEACELLAEVRRARVEVERMTCEGIAIDLHLQASGFWTGDRLDTIERVTREADETRAIREACRAEVERLRAELATHVEPQQTMASMAARQDELHAEVERLRAWERAARVAMEKTQLWLDEYEGGWSTPGMPTLGETRVALRAVLAQEVP